MVIDWGFVLFLRHDVIGCRLTLLWLSPLGAFLALFVTCFPLGALATHENDMTTNSQHAGTNPDDKDDDEYDDNLLI